MSQPPASTPAPDGRARLRRALLAPRASRGQLLAAALCLLLGFAAVAQVRSQRTEAALQTARQEDLVRILDDVTSRADRLEREARDLEASRQELLTSGDRSQAALDRAAQQAETLGILAGTVPATGPGIVLTIDDPARVVTGATLFDALQELRDAGAEAIEINNERVVASTHFVDEDGGVRMDSQRLEPPYRFVVVGDPQTLASALDIPGGVLEGLRKDGAEGTVTQESRVRVDALRAVETPQYARPATEGGSGG